MILFVISLLLVSFANYPGCIESKKKDWCGYNESPEQLKSNALRNVLPRKVDSKHVFKTHSASTFVNCVQLCCDIQQCNIAFYFSTTCFLIGCSNLSDEACQPIKGGDDGLDSEDSYWLTVRAVANNLEVVANAGGDQTIYLPSLVTLDGSRSKANKGKIIKYSWIKNLQSPAAGELVSGSFEFPILKLTDLAPGQYNFSLYVISDRNVTATDHALITVKPDPNILNMVNLHLEANFLNFTETDLISVKNQILFILQVASKETGINVKVVKILEDPSFHQTIIKFFVEQSSEKWPGNRVADILEKRLGDDPALLAFKVIKLETSVCQNKCSGHGMCDQLTRECFCDSFWVENLFAKHRRQSNCDWNVFNVGLVVVLIILLLIPFFCCTYCLCKKISCVRSKNNYKPLSRTSRRSNDGSFYKDQSIGLVNSASDDSEEETYVQGKTLMKVPTKDFNKKNISA